MTLGCNDVRRHLLEATTSPGGAISDHLDSCSRCARFAERRNAARALFRSHHGNVEPDARFAERVAARLPARSDVVFGWAVARVLPATLALLLVLMWVSWRSVPAAQPLDDPSPTEDVLTWVLGPTGEGR